MSSRNFRVIEGGLANSNRRTSNEPYLDCDLMADLGTKPEDITYHFPGGSTHPEDLDMTLEASTALHKEPKSVRRQHLNDAITRMICKLAEDWGPRQMIKDATNAMRKAMHKHSRRAS